MRDQFVEQLLDKYALRYIYEPALELAQIDWQLSRQNPTRLMAGPVDEETVERYTIAYKAGDNFPAICVSILPSGGYLLIGGTHRWLACQRAHVAFHDAYVLNELDTAVLRLVSFELNIRNGMGVSREQAITWGKLLVREFGVTQTEAAARMKIPESTLSRALRADDIQTRLVRDLKLSPLTGTVSDHVVLALGTLDNDNVLKAAHALVRDARLGQGICLELVRAIKAERTEADQLAVVALWRERPDMQRATQRAKQGKSVTLGGTPRRSRVVGYLQGLELAIRGATSLTSLQITHPQEQSEICRLWSIIAVQMEVLCGVRNGRVDQAAVLSTGRPPVAPSR